MVEFSRVGLSAAMFRVSSAGVKDLSRHGVGPMDAHTSDAQLIEGANDLYWHSEASVNQIADELGLSKGSLYSIIAPLPSGVACPRCEAEMVWPNRTARERGFVSCPECGFEEEEGLVGTSPAAKATPTASDARRHLSCSVDRLLVGTALLGIAAGAFAVHLLRKR